MTSEESMAAGPGAPRNMTDAILAQFDERLTRLEHAVRALAAAVLLWDEHPGRDLGDLVRDELRKVA